MFVLLATSDLGQAFAGIINGLCALLGHHAVRLRDRSVVLSLIHWRIARMVRRLDHLALRWQANTLPKPRPSRPRAKCARPAQPARLPSGRYWLIRALQPTAQFTPHIEAFLARPDTRALVEAAPQAGRILRPLCRGYGIELPSWLALPERPAPPPRVRTKPRPLQPCPLQSCPLQSYPPPTPFRPLPANIRAAARAWRKYDR